MVVLTYFNQFKEVVKKNSRSKINNSAPNYLPHPNLAKSLLNKTASLFSPIYFTIGMKWRVVSFWRGSHEYKTIIQIQK